MIRSIGSLSLHALRPRCRTLRSRRNLPATALALALVVGVGCGSSGSGSPGFVDPGERGPYPVGVRTVSFQDASRPNDAPSRGPRNLTTEVWYPAAPSARAQDPDPILGFLPADVLDLALGLVGDELDNLDASTEAVRDAVASGDGPFPLVLLSHGNASVRYQNFTLAEHLASHGFVVAAPDHIGNSILGVRADGSVTIINPLLIPVSFVDRVFDLSFLADQLFGENGATVEPFFEGLVDRAPGVGVAGHSFGGTTTLTFAATEPRVTAAMPMAPAVIPVLTPAPDVPTLFWTGLEDKTLADQSIEGSRLLFDRTGAPRILAEFRDGGHFTFTDGCAYLSAVFNGDGCGSGRRFDDDSTFDFVPDSVALPILNRTSTAFFRWTLAGDERMLDVLRENPDPDALGYRIADLPDPETPSAP